MTLDEFSKLKNAALNLDAKCKTLETLLWECVNSGDLSPALQNKMTKFLSTLLFSARNKTIFEEKRKGSTFREIAERHNISAGRASLIYHRMEIILAVENNGDSK
jgi:hypothetical protein